MNRLAREPFFGFDRLFNDFYRPSTTSVERNASQDKVFAPRVDIYELETSYELVAELPGVSKDNISVTVEDSTLTIESNNEPDTAEANEAAPARKLLRQERRFGKFQRSFKLGQDIEADQIQASFNDGLLVLNVPKAKEESRQRRIEIH